MAGEFFGVMKLVKPKVTIKELEATRRMIRRGCATAHWSFCARVIQVRSKVRILPQCLVRNGQR